MHVCVSHPSFFPLVSPERKKCDVPGLCYDFSNIHTFLNQKEVQSTLGVDSGREWQSCNMAVNAAFQSSGDWGRNFQQKLPDLMGDGIRVLM